MIDDIPELVDKINNFYMPGIRLIEYESLDTLENKLDLGFGLEIEEQYSSLERKVTVIVSHSGVLKFTKPNHIWIESMSKVYVPSEGDRIIGKVVKKAGDYYQIDFGGACYAHLNYLHFQDATKNNRVDLKMGDVIYCQVSLAGRGLEPEVTCVNSFGKSIGMGVIEHADYTIIKVDLPTARKLLNINTFPLLKKIGSGILPHEIIIGCNGWIYVAARSSREFVAMVNSVELANQIDTVHIKDLIRALRNGIYYTDN